MKLLVIFFGVIFGIIAFLGIIVLILYAKIKMAARKYGFSNIGSIIDEVRKGANDAKYNHKHVVGMTKLLKPSIEKDFPSFNESELFNMTETGLRTIFNSLEEQEVSDDLPLLREQLKQIIYDFKSDNINVRYDDVKFHDFSIKKYYKKNGVATIQVSTALEYFYKKMKGKKIVDDYSSYKKQTRYTVDFIYVYDITQIKDYTHVIGINCPNCGAPLTDLGNKICKYCHTALDDVNLKNWMFSSYKEDY